MLSPHAPTRLAARQKCDYTSEDYHRIVGHRGLYIGHYLDRGLDVLYLDVDVLLRRDPAPWFAPGCDVTTQMDGASYHCTGFLMTRHSRRTVALMRQWYDTMRVSPGLNQMPFNGLLKKLHANDELRACRLDRKLFPSGGMYYALDWPQLYGKPRPNTFGIGQVPAGPPLTREEQRRAVMVHANFMGGYAVKQQALGLAMERPVWRSERKEKPVDVDSRGGVKLQMAQTQSY